MLSIQERSKGEEMRTCKRLKKEQQKVLCCANKLTCHSKEVQFEKQKGARSWVYVVERGRKKRMEYVRDLRQRQSIHMCVKCWVGIWERNYSGRSESAFKDRLRFVLPRRFSLLRISFVYPACEIFTPTSLCVSPPSSFFSSAWL